MFVAFPILTSGRVLGVVYLSRTPKSVLRHLYEERYKAILALMTVLIIASLLAILISRTISRPIAELLDRTRQGTGGEVTNIEPPARAGRKGGV